VPAVGGLQGDLRMNDAEAELQIRLPRTDRRLLRAIEEALGRIMQGTYEIYGVCNQPISRARLEAVPWTHHCRDCKERKQSNGAVEGRSREPPSSLRWDLASRAMSLARSRVCLESRWPMRVAAPATYSPWLKLQSPRSSTN
jgi:RNA polymerase-binding transcription factor DksA